MRTPPSESSTILMRTPPPENTTVVIRYLTVGEQENYNRIAEEHRAMTDAANARAYLHNGNTSAGVSGVSGQVSHQGILHDHPRMQQNLKVPNDHVIIDRNEWVRARRRSGNR